MMMEQPDSAVSAEITRGLEDTGVAIYSDDVISTLAMIGTGTYGMVEKVTIESKPGD